MKKRIIETEITKAIHTIKCGQNLRITGNTRLMNTLAKFRKETCNPKKPRKTEKAIIINNNGETVIDKKGDKNSVTWNSNEILKAFTENNELHIEHNHPLYENPKLPVFLSGDDIIRIRDKIGQYKNGIYTGDQRRQLQRHRQHQTTRNNNRLPKRTNNRIHKTRHHQY